MENSPMVEGVELKSFAVVAAADRRLGNREMSNVVVRRIAPWCSGACTLPQNTVVV